jgi:hypothetical protein
MPAGRNTDADGAGENETDCVDGNSRRAYLNVLIRVTNHDIVRRTIRIAFMQIALILSQFEKTGTDRAR